MKRLIGAFCALMVFGVPAVASADGIDPVPSIKLSGKIIRETKNITYSQSQLEKFGLVADGTGYYADKEVLPNGDVLLREGTMTAVRAASKATIDARISRSTGAKRKSLVALKQARKVAARKSVGRLAYLGYYLNLNNATFYATGYANDLHTLFWGAPTYAGSVTTADRSTDLGDVVAAVNVHNGHSLQACEWDVHVVGDNGSWHARADGDCLTGSHGTFERVYQLGSPPQFYHALHGTMDAQADESG